MLLGKGRHVRTVSTTRRKQLARNGRLCASDIQVQISYVLFSVFLSMFFFLTKIELSIENFPVVRRKLKYLRDFVGFYTLVFNELCYSLGDYFGISLMVHHIALGLILPFYNMILSANGDSQAITESIREVIAVIIMKTSLFYKRNDRVSRQTANQEVECIERNRICLRFFSFRS